MCLIWIIWIWNVYRELSRFEAASTLYKWKWVLHNMMQSITYSPKIILPINQANNEDTWFSCWCIYSWKTQKLPSYCLQSYSKFCAGYTARFINTIRNNVTHIIASKCEISQSCLLKRINNQEITHRNIFIPKARNDNDKKQQLALKVKAS